ncbi:MAG: anthranilate synthase component I [Chloroflexi bacterium]|nr:anthranilate synthase component I [Chloroflexota bacterium]
MIHPTYSDFETLATRGNLLPVYRELAADLETPVSVYLKLRGEGESILLESVEGGERLARYSFLAINPARVLTIRGDQVTVRNHTRTEQFSLYGGEPLTALRDFVSPYQAVSVPGLPRFFGGAVGYLSYDVVRRFERLPNTARDTFDLPDALFLLTDTLIAFDHVKHRLLVIANAHVDARSDPRAAYDNAIARIDDLVARLNRPTPLSAPAPWHNGHQLESNVTSNQFAAMVERAKEHIAAGDIFQVVLSQRFTRETDADAFSIYRSLRRINPSPYMFFLDLVDVQFIGSSPEVLVRLEDGIAQLNPIAGTRPRGKTEQADVALEKELCADQKERAEHVMLVDLGRNDLGRVCEYGSVQVPVYMTVERYSHVMHLVSRVIGKLRVGLDAFDLLRATFPAGTVSGAPKVRAMEIIEELEGVRRGPYAGAVGYFGFSVAGKSNMDFCITIRTIVKRGLRAFIQAGAGIVADSEPLREHQECANKARALAEAIELAERNTQYATRDA